jgi:hypothetical protein
MEGSYPFLLVIRMKLDCQTCNKNSNMMLGAPGLQGNDESKAGNATSE